MNKELRPLLRNTVQVINRNDRFLFLEPEIPDWLVIKSRYCSILHMMNGKHYLQEIIAHIRKVYGDEASILINQVIDFVSTSFLLTNNSITLTKTMPPQLRYVYITITDRCNLNCVYCYAKQRNPSNELSVQQWISIINKFIDLSKNIVFTFTGGEPLLASGIFELAAHINKRNSKSILLTNGQLLQNEKFAKKASNLFSEIRISIDSVEEDINANLRGKNTLKRALTGYQNCCKNGNTPIIMCTVTSFNMKHLKSLIGFFGDNCIFQPLFKMGSAEKHSEFAISGNAYYRVLKDASAPICMPGLYRDIHSYRSNPYKRCAMAIEELSVGPDGTIFPCHMLHYNELRVGDALNDNIEQLYNESKVLKTLRSLNVDSIDQCTDCQVRNFCGAGCRARIGIKGVKKEEIDSFCSFEKESILDALFCSFD